MKAQITVTVNAAGREFTESDIIDVITQETFDSFRTKQPGGIFKAFVVCHEGESHPKLLSTGKHEKIVWPKEAVESAFNKIKNGIKFFFRHRKDHSQKDRESFGEIVGKSLRVIDGKLSTVIIGHFPKDKREKAEASASISMEAVWNLVQGAKEIIAESVDVIRGIALGAPEDVPAFSGANELATVEAFKEDMNMNENGQATLEPDTDEGFEDFKSFKDGVRKFRVFPSNIFTPEQILGRRIIKKDGNVAYIDGDRNVQEWFERNIVASIQQESAETIEQLKKENAELRRKVAMVEAAPKLEELGKEMNLPDRVLNLAKDNLSRFNPGENLEESYKQYLEEQKAEDERLIKLGYIAPDQSAPAMAAPALGPSGGKPPTDEKNPLLPEDEQ